LSILDMMMNCGDSSMEIVREENHRKETRG